MLGPAQWSLDIVLTSRQPGSHRSQSTVTQTQADEKMIYSRHCQVIFTPRRHTTGGVDLALGCHQSPLLHSGCLSCLGSQPLLSVRRKGVT